VDIQRSYRSVDAKLQDGSGVETGTEDNRLDVESRDSSTYMILGGILDQLRLIRTQLELMTDQRISKADLGGE